MKKWLDKQYKDMLHKELYSLAERVDDSGLSEADCIRCEIAHLRLMSKLHVQYLVVVAAWMMTTLAIVLRCVK